MTTTTYPLHNPSTYRALRFPDLTRRVRASLPAAAPRVTPKTAPALESAHTQGLRYAARLVSNTSAIAALMATVTLTILAVSAYAKAQASVWPWFIAWAVAVVSLLVVARFKDQLGHLVLRGLARWHEHRLAVRTEREIADAVRRDPRMREELQAILDPAEWSAILARLPH